MPNGSEYVAPVFRAVLRWLEQQIMCSHHWHTVVSGRARAACCWCQATTRRRRPRDERRDCNRPAG